MPVVDYTSEGTAVRLKAEQILLTIVLYGFASVSLLRERSLDINFFEY